MPIDYYRAAFELVRRRRTCGNFDATANLGGALYIKGLGVAKNPNKAAELFEKGARANNAPCMAFYAQCLEARGLASKRILDMAILVSQGREGAGSRDRH